MARAGRPSEGLHPLHSSPPAAKTIDLAIEPRHLFSMKHMKT